MFWAVTTYFNPSKYAALKNNYFVFRDRLKQQNVPLLTVELSFDGFFDLPDDCVRVSSRSVMWQKERLINYAASLLPASCTSFGWLDCDVLFPDGWVSLAEKELQSNDVIQLYKKVYYLQKDARNIDNGYQIALQGVVWQNKIHRNWLNRRKNKDLPFSTPGFAWATRMDSFRFYGGLYDRNIIGSGDTFFVDCLLNSWEIHGYAKKFTPAMKIDMEKYAYRISNLQLKTSYIPVDIWHLYHGELKNRAYMDRHDILLKNDFDPNKDIVLYNNVYEWNSDKPDLHNSIISYFQSRKEDG